MNAMVKLQKLYTLQIVNSTQLNIIGSLEALVPWNKYGFMSVDMKRL